MDTQILQYGFLRAAQKMERIIMNQYKEDFRWAEYQIRKQLQLDKTQSLPQNWKQNISALLNDYMRSKYEEKVNRCKELQKILSNFYTILKQYESKIDALMQHIEMQEEVKDFNHESSQLYLQLLEESIKKNQLQTTTWADLH